MTLPISGPISLADVNIELRRPPGQPITMADGQLLGLAGFQGGSVSMSMLYGKFLYPPRGQYLGRGCEGFRLYDAYTDGDGGRYLITAEDNSPACGYVPPPPPPPVYPPRGVFQGQACRDFALVNVYTDGNGGTYDIVIDGFSTVCGATAPGQN